MKKFILLILLCSFALFITACGTASEDAQFLYSKTDTGVVITGISVNAQEIRIPAQIDGSPVVAIADNAFYRNEQLRKVTLPSTLLVVGGHAFADSKNLNTVVFEKGGEILLGDSVFENCSLLSTVRLNGSVTAIGDGTFRDCERIFTIKFGEEVESIGFEAFKGCERTLFEISNNPEALNYAKENHLATSFTDSVYFIYLQLLLIALGLVLLFFGYKFFKKRKKK